MLCDLVILTFDLLAFKACFSQHMVYSTTFLTDGSL